MYSQHTHLYNPGHCRLQNPQRVEGVATVVLEPGPEGAPEAELLDANALKPVSVRKRDGVDFMKQHGVTFSDGRLNWCVRIGMDTWCVNT